METIVYDNYIINDKGEVYSLLKKKKLKTSINQKGYEQIYIMVEGKKKTTFLHRLLAIAFIPNPENKETVNHINGNKLDNRIENLEWATNKENINHAFNKGLKEIKPIILHDLESNTDLLFNSIKSCADYLGCKQYTVSRVASGIRKTLYKKYTVSYQ